MVSERSDRSRGLRAARRAAARKAPDEVSPEVSARRSGLALWGPVTVTIVAAALGELLVVAGHAPRTWTTLGLFFAALAPAPLWGQTDPFYIRRGTIGPGRHRLTQGTWTGARTVDLSQLSRVRRVRFQYRSLYPSRTRLGIGTGWIRVQDYYLVTDQHGARLAIRDTAAVSLLAKTLREHQGAGRPSISRYAAIGLQLAPDSRGFRVGRALLVWLIGIAYLWGVGWLLVIGIPAIA